LGKLKNHRYAIIAPDSKTNREVIRKMDRLSQGKWWALLIRGLIAIILGVLVLSNLEAGVMAVLLFIGYYLIFEGLLKIGEAYVRHKSGEKRLPTLLAGFGSLIIGVVVIAWPQISVTILIALVATQALIQGASDIYSSIAFRKDLEKRWIMWLLLGGIAQLLFGLWMIFQPIIGGLTTMTVLAIYAIVIGVVLIIRAFQERLGGGGTGAVASA